MWGGGACAAQVFPALGALRLVHPHGLCSAMLAPWSLPAPDYRVCLSTLIRPLAVRLLLLEALNNSAHTIATMSKSRTRMTP
jgi:hypothetical protein